MRHRISARLVLIFGIVFGLLATTAQANAATVKATAQSSAPATPKALVLYDTTGPWGYLGELYAIEAANLVGHFGTYTAESYRAGIDAVPRGQWDAAAALNLPRLQTWTKVVLPQAVPPILAAQGNWILIIFKGTALLSTVTVVELVSKSQQIGSDHLDYLEPTVLVGIFFMVVSYPASLVLRRYERRITRHR